MGIIKDRIIYRRREGGLLFLWSLAEGINVLWTLDMSPTEENDAIKYQRFS